MNAAMSCTDSAQPVSTRIAQRVMRLPKGQPFSTRRFAALGTRSAVSKAIARLVSRGELERVHRGVYMRPKSSRYVARVRPNAWEVVSLIARQSRQALQIHGANAVRRFGLSTQMPLISIYYTSGSSRSLFIGKLKSGWYMRHQWSCSKPGPRWGWLSAHYFISVKTVLPRNALPRSRRCSGLKT